MLILDTSALIQNYQDRTSPAESAVTYHVVEELDKLKLNPRTKHRQQAQIRWIIENGVSVLKVDQPTADDSLLEAQKLHSGRIVTCDAQLYLRQIHSGLEQELIEEKLPDYIHDPIQTIDVDCDLSGKSKQIEYPQWLEGKYQIVRSGNSTRIARLLEGKAHFVNVKQFSVGEMKVQQLNVEQQILLQALEDTDVQLVTQVGIAGSGKTFLTLQAQLKLVEAGKYQNIIVSVPPVQLGGVDRYGFLPGTIGEKMIMQFSGIIDNLRMILGLAEANKIIKEQIDGESPIIQLQQFSNIRGRSIKNSIVIIDEAQNMTVLEAKTFLTRIDVGSKIVMLGDIEQIDTGYYSEEQNGLIATQLQFKDAPCQMHIALKRCCRSEVQRIQTERL